MFFCCITSTNTYTQSHAHVHKPAAVPPALAPPPPPPPLDWAVSRWETKKKKSTRSAPVVRFIDMVCRLAISCETISTHFSSRRTSLLHTVNACTHCALFRRFFKKQHCFHARTQGGKSDRGTRAAYMSAARCIGFKGSRHKEPRVASCYGAGSQRFGRRERLAVPVNECAEREDANLVCAWSNDAYSHAIA